ncbi:MAG: DUF402 domain-containing protein [Candidatus Cohnella colombiensis]|uniref:DUF402 domain-containing protein n=1 Tax=Candidatus Cohnella colombiensis TaxID=3121368 RepID=A0AA95F6D0_9BACL|nr:MAG: DUF402 domain-containing protein [Cohnella sp.]
MKRKFSDRANWRRILKRSYACIPMDEPYFRGFVTLYRIHELKDPLWKEYNGRKMCLADRGYLWLQHFPKGEHYVVTTMFDDKGQVVQWYIDICKTQGLTEQQVPWFDDLYLDIVVLPTGEKMLLDEDELEEALDEGHITQRDSVMAQKTAANLLDQIHRNAFPFFDLSVQHRKQFVEKLGWEKG